MEQWLGIIGNLGVGGGLAFFFAWYLVRTVIPSLTRENGQQREAFLGELMEQRRQFLVALRELKESSQLGMSRVSQEMGCLATEVRRTGELVVELGERREAAQR